MGTSNFCYENICVAVLMDEVEDRDILVEEVQYRMGELAREGKFKFWDEDKYDHKYGGLSYSSCIIGEIETPSFQWYGLKFYIRADIRLNGGYYQGACLDYTIGYYEADLGEFDFVFGEKEWENTPKKLGKYLANREHQLAPLIAKNINGLEKRMTDIEDGLKAILEAELSKFGQNLATFARFSNGETWYTPK